MSTNRSFYVLVGIAVVAVMTLTSWEAFATKAVLTADRSYDQIEQARGAQMDHSYDAIESVRGSQQVPAELNDSNSLDSATREYIGWAKAIELRQLDPKADRSYMAAANVDRSYDAIESLRGGQQLPAELQDSNSLDSATREYIGWATAIELQQLDPKADRSNMAAANVDRSYDAIENLRAQRTIQ